MRLATSTWCSTSCATWLNIVGNLLDARQDKTEGGSCSSSSNEAFRFSHNDRWRKRDANRIIVILFTGEKQDHLDERDLQGANADTIANNITAETSDHLNLGL